MYNLHIIEVIYIVSVINVVITEYANYKNNYVSLESGDQDRNQVDNGYEDYNDIDEKATQGNFTLAPGELQHTLITSSPLALENTTSHFNCKDKKTGSSEENPCTNTLVSYPYAASVQRKGAHYASAALITTQFVLTVAGVFYHVRESIKLFKVRLGSVDCKKGGISLPIKSVEVHPLYVHGKPSFDLALIKLARPVQPTDYIKPIRLSRYKNTVISAKFMTTYWPRIIVNGTLLPKTAKERMKYHSMRVSTQKLIPWKTCSIMMKARETILDETSLCLKPLATHHSICMPDVGAPVIADDTLWGVTSGWTSKHCTTYPSPTIVTRTAMPPVRTWLESILKVHS